MFTLMSVDTVGPGPLMELADTVTFSQDLSPLLQINFTVSAIGPRLGSCSKDDNFSELCVC